MKNDKVYKYRKNNPNCLYCEFSKSHPYGLRCAALSSEIIFAKRKARKCRLYEPKEHADEEQPTQKK